MGDQLREGSTSIVGVMLESNLYEGNQKAPVQGGLSSLRPGVSITDACIDWETTVSVLEQLADAVRVRRLVKGIRATGLIDSNVANGCNSVNGSSGPPK